MAGIAVPPMINVSYTYLPTRSVAADFVCSCRHVMSPQFYGSDFGLDDTPTAMTIEAENPIEVTREAFVNAMWKNGVYV